jgi:endonuclease/exonuclease/phosphatase family metal-dependent hydrolase
LNGAVVTGIVVVLAASACDRTLTEGSEWRAWDTIDGVLRPEVNLVEYAAGPSGDPVRVVTFNAHFGEDIALIATGFEDHEVLSQADVLLIQEIESHESEGLSRAAQLAGRLGMNHVYAPSRTEGVSGTHGLAILSRYALEAVEVMQLPKAELHIRPRQRIALAASIAIGDQALRVVNVHLDVRLNIAQRIRQHHPVTLSADERVVIAGDFNTNPYLWAGAIPIAPDQVVSDPDQAEMFDDYMRAYGFDTPTADSGATQQTVVRDFRLDSVYTRDLSPIDAGVAFELALSDHYPLWVDVDVTN